MHGARAIMAAEPPSRQDLQQKPTILVEPANGSEDKEKKKSKADKKKSKKDTSLDTTNQDQAPQDQALQSQSQALLKDTSLQASNPSLSSTEHDTYL